MTMPFYCAVQPADAPPFVATLTGLRFRTPEQAAAVLASIDALFDGGIPLTPWPPFLPAADVIKAQRGELVAAIGQLGWSRR